MVNQKDVVTWQTWKKRNNPITFSVQDGVKGWAVQTTVPTLQAYGFIEIYFDTDYNYSEGIKLKDKAINEINYCTYCKELGFDKFEYVYNLYRGTNGYQDAFYVYARLKDEFKDLRDCCLTCQHYKPNLVNKNGFKPYYSFGLCNHYNQVQFPYSKCNFFKKQ